ncbi:dihydrolipoamide acetyltransferase family protein [Mucisphaera calidilacus]|uniref:Dihydrolipoamide acetyltransferase component of pyruvate dehydrogenase complex n=1 Tax=Mucisphaera calidilacus TaxID=2527982 RepID=A0A518C0Z0_9BACT|nr:dihydrolipoamide acetyltransferase family protein [Mucisphaera calidilacus]QDU72892.1 Dihydrolipoyllysine-residue acetyltransferase component of pyruvate dehydrogenase complex [Mucisphaera calidilacus]
MPITIEMPRLSDTMEEGTLLKWNVGVGDKVSAGDHLADVETDKATMELQAFEDGTVARIQINEGDTVPIGEVIMVLAGDGESVEDAAAAEAPSSGDAEGPQADADDTSSDDAAADEPAKSAESASAPKPSGGKIKVSPLARKLAEEKGVDLASIQGTGPDGRIIKRDILKAAEGGSQQSGSAPASEGVISTEPIGAGTAAPATAATSLEAKTIKLSGMRKTIARRLVESKTTVPHFSVSAAVSMDALLELRSTLNQQLDAQNVKLSVNDFILRAVALAAVQHPVVNSSWGGDSIQQHGTVNIGIAVALPEERGGGLVVPVINDVQNKGLRQISAETKALAKKARETGLSPEEMSGSTIAVSNIGMYGSEMVVPIINPPNAVIMGIGAALQQAVVKDGQIVPGYVMRVTLSGDHRVVDGATAAEYLQTLTSMLEQPAGLLV